MTGTPTPALPAAPDGGAEDEASYGTRVEEAFIAERGTPFLLSPKDWRLICGWRESGVPSGTVIRAVREAFERKRARGDLSKISSLSYCANAVEVLWEMERRGLVGAHGARTETPTDRFEAAPRLASLAEELEAAKEIVPAEADPVIVRAALEAARAALGELDPAAGLESLEESLGGLEKALVKKLEKALGDADRSALEREVEEEAGDLAALSKEARGRIQRALRARAVRRRFGLPALTLLGG
ncbi:MAG: hypothetical protein ACYDBY_03815 [Thermoanaerobaculia bacterium]